MKNPRRAYDAQGKEIAPLTVGQHLANGFRLVEITCATCHHHASVDVSKLPRDLAVPDIALKARCTACGSRRCTSGPDMQEYYRRTWSNRKE